MDVLTDVLRTLRLAGTVYFQAEFSAPWGMDIKAGAVANFHIVAHGRCWLRATDLDAAIQLDEGDIVLFPRGMRHVLAHSAAAQAAPAEDVLEAIRATSQAPPSYGGGGERTTLICGHFSCERVDLHPLLRALPPLLHVAAGGQRDPQWIATATRLMLAESGLAEPGSEAIVDRLAESLLIQVIRSHVRAQSVSDGFLAALSDPPLASALALMHARPGHGWSLGELAREVGVSRSVLAHRFKETVGESPISYLTQWRMVRAAELLRDGEASVARVAEQMGYQSEWAFAKAFKRVLGTGPGDLRRA